MSKEYRKRRKTQEKRQNPNRHHVCITAIILAEKFIIEISWHLILPSQHHLRNIRAVWRQSPYLQYLSPACPDPGKRSHSLLEEQFVRWVKDEGRTWREQFHPRQRCNVSRIIGLPLQIISKSQTVLPIHTCFRCSDFRNSSVCGAYFAQQTPTHKYLP